MPCLSAGAARSQPLYRRTVRESLIVRHANLTVVARATCSLRFTGTAVFVFVSQALLSGNGLGSQGFAAGAGLQAFFRPVLSPAAAATTA
jgi:hypothetical protein